MRAWNKKRKPKHHSKAKLLKETSRVFLGSEKIKFYCRVMRNKLKKLKMFWFGKRLGGTRKKCKAILLVKRKQY